MAWVLPGKVIAGEKKLWRGSYLFRCHWGASFLSLSFPLSFSSSFFPSLSPTLLFPLALSNHAFLQWYTDSPRTKSRYAGWNGLSVSVGVLGVERLSLWIGSSLILAHGTLFLLHPDAEVHTGTNKIHFPGCRQCTQCSYQYGFNNK